MSKKIYKDFLELVDKAVKHTGENKYYNCELTLKYGKTTLEAHEVSICNRDLLFFTDVGTINYVVDSYGDRHIVEIVHVELD